MESWKLPDHPISFTALAGVPPQELSPLVLSRKTNPFISYFQDCKRICQITSQAYYQRQVKEAVPHRDKNKMLVLNAVRNTLISRIYAVVNRGEKYNKNYTAALV